ncbi:MAG: hypothetical protein EOO09_04200 [Chitinophagaceae bacterium]|nr:MAG: hypothetical protein EOO09_04200 [Chitinophagaceae bacterium]
MRLKIFAGPNGSGKSTIISSIRQFRTNQQLLDFGFYVNSDDIVVQLENDGINFQKFGFRIDRAEFIEISMASGLVADGRFTYKEFINSFGISGNRLTWQDGSSRKSAAEKRRSAEALAQVVSHFLHRKLIRLKKKFSLETVFSHAGKLELIRTAVEAGYKVYLYFVSTESPEINKHRVLAREKKGGHHVDPVKISRRYTRSLDLLYEAAQLCYRTYFIDNSADNAPANFFADFKMVDGVKVWNTEPGENAGFPNWFLANYSKKIPKS